MQLLIYFINYDLWDDGDMHGPSTRIMKTDLKYYIGAVGRSSGGVRCRADSADIAAATSVLLPPPANRDHWKYWTNYWTNSDGGTGGTSESNILCIKNRTTVLCL